MKRISKFAILFYNNSSLRPIYVIPDLKDYFVEDY